MRIPIILAVLAFSIQAYGQRQKERINFDWKFTLGAQQGAENVDYDDSRWQTVHLPHDASISGPFVRDSLNSDQKNGFLPRRTGWYRKALSIDQDLSGRKAFLEFEGVYRDARVYVNGKELAHQLNGFEGFLVDITEAAKTGSNVISVSYDNTDKESSRWYNGEGIYRDVWLLITERAHINYNGVFVTAPITESGNARAEIRTETVNASDSIMEITLKSEIFSPGNQKIGEISNIAPVSAGEIYPFSQSIDIPDPQLWDLETPFLYSVKTTVSSGEKKLDEYETSFGIRSIELDREQGLILNGRKVLVKGVNIHHDLGPLGAAAFERGFARRLEGLKKLGCNAVRLSHNPHDAYVLEWCDRNGMLVLDEAFDKWDDQFFGQGNAFADHWKKSLEWLIKRDRNHPSVMMWSVGNETRQQRDRRANFGVPVLKEMVAFARELDPTRKVTCGLHPSRKSGAYRTENYYREGPPEMVFYMDVVSTNYREEFWPVDKAAYPQLIFLLSEAQVGNLGNEWFNFNHDSSVGLFYWGGTDYIGESFGWPSKGWPNGIIDWNDHWKPFSYYIQSLYSEEPVAHIAAYDPEGEQTKYWNEVQLRYQPMYSHWNWQGRDSVTLLTFSNGQEVELFLNGRSMGAKKVPDAYYTKDIKAYTAEEYDPDHPINMGPEIHKELEWTIPYEPGTIRAETRIDGKTVATHELRTASKPDKIVLKADREKISADGLDLSYVTATVVDKEGVIIPNANHNLTFSVSGAGVFAGAANADIASSESFASPERKVFQGKALLVVRSKREAGSIRVRAAAKGLKSATITIVSE